MNARRLAAGFLLLANPALSQGFAGLGTDAEGFAVPSDDPSFTFPADHGPHPEFRIEWWYVTATLTDADGQDYGVQWTLFRSALRPEASHGWDASQLWMGHAGLTTSVAHYHAERLARGGIGQAGARPEPFEAWIDDWSMTSVAESGADGLSALSLEAAGENFSYDLLLQATGPLVFHGDDGFSVKSADGQASYYYSQPFYEVAGTLTLPSRDVAVTGSAWLDREWSSQPLSVDQDGWDWFSLQFEDGARLMGFGLRSGTQEVYTSATWIDADGKTTTYPDGVLQLTPVEYAEVAGRSVPVEWQVDLPERGVSISTEPLNPQSWMDTSFPYWEGPIRFSGSHAGKGYLEMTGYE